MLSSLYIGHATLFNVINAKGCSLFILKIYEKLINFDKPEGD